MVMSYYQKIFYEALKELNEREKEILILRYGLSNNDELTQKDVADLLGISQSYISRLEKKIIKKLRSQLNYDEVKQYIFIKKSHTNFGDYCGKRKFYEHYPYSKNTF